MCTRLYDKKASNLAYGQKIRRDNFYLMSYI